MKIKNLKYANKMNALAFAFVLSLTGCGKQVSTVQLDRSQETIKEFALGIESLNDEFKKKIEEAKKYKKLTTDEICDLTDKIDDETAYMCYYEDFLNKLTLKPKLIYYGKERRIPDSSYSDINLLLNQPDIEKLDLETTNFDLSKLDILNLKEVYAFQISFENIKEMIKLASDNNIKLIYHIVREDNLKVLNYMIENNITCDSLIIGVNDEKELVEILSLLEKTKVKSINLALPHIENQNIDVSVKLNDHISSISLSGNYLFSEDLEGDKKLLNVEISSNNPELKIYFDDVIINENTKFVVPNNSEVWIYGSYTDIMPLYDLKNTSKVYYYDSILCDGFHSDEVETYYDFVEQINEAHGKSLVK